LYCVGGVFCFLLFWLARSLCPASRSLRLCVAANALNVTRPQHRPIPRNRAPHVTHQPNATTTEFEQSSFWWDGQWDMSIFFVRYPHKKKQKRGERNVNEEGRGPPPTCRLYLYLFFTFLSLSLSPSIPCHVGAAALGWGENCGGIIKWEETIYNTQSSRQPATLYTNQLQPDKFPKSSRVVISFQLSLI
jgi:hypothetical protein